MIEFDINRYKKQEKLAATEWQQRAYDVIEEFKVPHKKKSQFYMWFRNDRSKAEGHYNYIAARDNIDTPWRYFAYLMTH